MEANGSPAVITKVAKFRILKPVGVLTWDQLGKLLRDARYRVYRLANLAISEAYLNFHMFRSGRQSEFKSETSGRLSRRLREMLSTEKTTVKELDRFSKTGALPDTVVGALSQYKIRAVTNVNKWAQVIKGQASLPTFRLDMPIPIRCDKSYQRRLERAESGDVVVELMICAKPYPRVVLQTGDIGDGQAAVLQRLLDNKEQSPNGYRQRLFEVKQEKFSKKWHLFVTYDLPAPKRSTPDKDIVVGVDLGFRVPLYVAEDFQ